MHSSGMLRSVDWQLVTDVSGQRIGPILKGQAVQEGCLTLEYGPVCCPETSVTKYNSTLRKNPEERRFQTATYFDRYSVINASRYFYPKTRLYE